VIDLTRGFMPWDIPMRAAFFTSPSRCAEAAGSSESFRRANKRHMPYQPLIKAWLAEKVGSE
jgi:hypothetical protein